MSNSAESTSSASTESKSPEELKAEGFSHLSGGKRHLLVSDVPEAVSTLALACDLLSKQFGETHYECAEAYLYYGKSLLEMSRLESGVLGHALAGVPEEGDVANSSQVEDPEKMTSDEKTEVEAKVKEALDYNYQTCEVEAEATAKEAAAEEIEGDNTEDEEDADESMEDVADAPTEDKKEASAGDSTMDGEEETSNLQLSWEMLELAKVVYTKQLEASTDETKVEVEKKICEAYLLLGEVSLENENYQQAVDDLALCLSKRQASHPSDSRSIAETHYQLGIAQAYNEKYEEAESSMKSAMAVLHTRVVNLQKMESSGNLKKEILELQDLVKEIKERIVDHDSMKAGGVAKKIKSDFSSSSGNSDLPSKPVSSIAIKSKEEVVKVTTNVVKADTAAAAM